MVTNTRSIRRSLSRFLFRPVPLTRASLASCGYPRYPAPTFFFLDPLHVITMSQSHHDAVASSLQQFLDQQHLRTSTHESGNSQIPDATPNPRVLHALQPPRGRIDATTSDDSSSADPAFTTHSLSNSEPWRNNVGIEGYGFRPPSGASSPAALQPAGTGSSTPIPDPHGLGWPGMSSPRSISPPLVSFYFSAISQTNFTKCLPSSVPSFLRS